MFPTCNHDLVTMHRGKPVIDAGAVRRFIAHVRQQQQRVREAEQELGIPGGQSYSEETLREQAWSQAGYQLDLATTDEADLQRWLAEAILRIDPLACREGEREEHQRRAAACRRALDFKARNRALTGRAA